MNTLCLLTLATLLTVADDRPLQLKSQVTLLAADRPSLAVPFIGFTAGALLGTAGPAAIVFGLLMATSGGNLQGFGELIALIFVAPGAGAVLIAAAMFFKAARLLREYVMTGEQMEQLDEVPKLELSRARFPLTGLTTVATF